MPGPVGNSNAMTTGLTAGKLPDGCSHIAKVTKKLRTALEQAVAANNGGTITLTAASTINLALRAEQVAKLCQRWLNLHEGSMTHSDRMQYVAKMLAATEARDKAIRSLRLDHSDPMQQLHDFFNSPTTSPLPHAAAPQDSLDVSEAVLPTPDAATGLSEIP